jgi:hypothetical protein
MPQLMPCSTAEPGQYSPLSKSYLSCQQRVKKLAIMHISLPVNCGAKTTETLEISEYGDIIAGTGVLKAK